MDFAVLPPEINSGRMYAGPGSGPMLAAAAAWDELAADLYSKAASCGSVISGLTGGPWLGPASVSMTAAVGPYLAWMITAAAQAEQAATQAKTAAVAYETAFAVTVPVPLIAANRSLLMALVATNFLGQNTPAIMATEAHYMEMWAQDVAAMIGYAAHSATAAALTPFSAPTSTTNPAGLAGQAAAVAHAAAAGAGSGVSHVMSVGPHLMSAVPQALQGLASSTSSASPLSGLLGLASGSGSSASSLPSLTSIPSYFGPLASLGGMSTSTTSATMSANSVSTNLRNAAANQERLVRDEAQGLIRGGAPGDLGGLRSVGLGGAIANASLGQSSSIGALSVPQRWAAVAPTAIRPLAAALPISSVSAAPQALTGSAGNTFSDMALAGMAGRALGGAAGLGHREGVGASTGKPLEPAQTSPGGAGTGIAAELRELAELRDRGILTDEEFVEQKQRVLGR